MSQNNQKGRQGGAAGQPPATIVAQPEPEICLRDIQVALSQARLRRRRGLWRAAQMYLRPHSEAPNELPVPERLALARVNLINELLARATQDSESDAASNAIADRVDNTGTLIPGIDNAARREVQDPITVHPYRYVPYSPNPEHARLAQRFRVGQERNTSVSEPRDHLQAAQIANVRNDIDNWHNNQDIDLEEMERDNEDEDDDLDFCPELGDRPPEPNQG